MKTYKSTFTGENFLYFETRLIAKLALEGLSQEEIKDKILKDNLFQYKTTKRAGRRITDISKRLRIFDNDFLKYFNQSSNEEGRILNLYILYKNNLLLSDFMDEVIRNKYEIQQFILEDFEIKNFFNKISQVDPKINNWKEYTIYKLTQVLRKILIESGILKKNKNYELLIPYISEEQKKFFLRQDASLFLESIGCKLYK